MSVSPRRNDRAPGAALPLEGELVRPGDEGWDESRRAFNLAVDQRPAEIVFPESAEDVADAVRLVIERSQRIAAQGTGHNAGPLGSLDDTMLLKTDRMRGVAIDPEARIARVEAGVVWTEVVEAAALHGLAALAGSSPNVGVVGYTLGGGLSFLGRKYGASANHVQAVEAVTADAGFVRADSDHEPDLFWALRGGGGSFGVVTEIELQLFPITEIYAGILWFPRERAGEVLPVWRDLTYADPPDELTTIGRLMNFPALPEVPEAVRDKSFVLVEAYHLGEPAQADELLAPLRALGPVNDTIQAIPMPAMSHLHMDPEQPAPGVGDGLLLTGLPTAALDALLEVTGTTAEVPLGTVEMRHLGGELGRARPGNGALASVPAPYAMFAAGITPTPDSIAPTRAQVEATKKALAPWAARQMYLNFAETRADPASLWSEQAYQRLRQIKAKVDPGDLIRSNQPIPPAELTAEPMPTWQ
jgi:FAD binding domain/Berberine and berberine like